jgi:hypothetical protein
MTPSAAQQLYDSLIKEADVRSLLGGRTFDQYLTHLTTLTPTPEPEPRNPSTRIPGL